MGKKDDYQSDLAPDATLATDLGDETKRTAEQLEYYGGEKDDIDDFDPTDLDDGSNFDPDNPAPAASKDDDETDDKDESDEDADEDADDDSDSDDSKDDDGSSDDGDEDTADDDKGDDDDDSGEEEEDSEDEEEPDPKAAPKGIPKHRFDQVNQRAKTAEAEIARRDALEAAKDQGEEEVYDFDAAEKEYLTMSLDGDVDGALAKRKEIRAAEHEVWKAETKAESKTEIAADNEEAELIALSKEAEKMFDVFNPDHEDFDQSMLNKVLTYYRGYAVSGEAETRGDAFVMALADVAEMHNLMPPEEDAADDKDDDGEPERKPTGKKKTDKKRKKKLAEQAHQPVGTDGEASSDAGAVAPSINDMTDEEMDALPAKTLARMRGDFG